MSRTASSALGLVRAAHAVPALAVVVLSVLLAVAADLPGDRVVLVGLTVLAGQLTIGWSNDLVDESRDRAVGRTDKPLVAGAVRTGTVRIACAAAVAATALLSVLCGIVPGLVHLLVVASAWAYNLGLKSTVWSWLPYAVSFGSLVAFVSLADVPAQWAPWWLVTAGALLGVGAHLLNVLPDLAEDAATGVRGLPHRIGARRLPLVATAVLTTGTLVVAAGAGLGRPSSIVALVVAGLLAVVVVSRTGRVPFLAAIGIALTDVLLLLGRG